MSYATINEDSSYAYLEDDALNFYYDFYVTAYDAIDFKIAVVAYDSDGLLTSICMVTGATPKAGTFHVATGEYSMPLDGGSRVNLMFWDVTDNVMNPMLDNIVIYDGGTEDE